MAGSIGLAELPQSAIRLIGSGQVITSVFSVVKELIENSFDAGSTVLDIKLEDYGLEKIEVCDNGCGISSTNIPYMAKRHYTSKIFSAEDLLTLTTYGFRGEALASLCAVSEMSITTKTASDDVSFIYTIDTEGNIKDKKPSHLGTGTTVVARGLFRNLPVRKQYYKTSQKKKDDLKRIEDLLMVFGIIRPQLRITLRHNRDVLFQKLPGKDTKSVLHSVYGRQVSSQLLYRQRSMDAPDGKVYAYIPKPGSDVKIMSRSAVDRTFVVVNERPVHMKELNKVLRQYYSNCHACESPRYPVCYVQVCLPTSDVDVNVDPNKTTVFLQHLPEVRRCLEEVLLEVYGILDNVPSWHYSDADKQEQENEEKNEGSSIRAKISSKFKVDNSLQSPSKQSFTGQKSSVSGNCSTDDKRNIADVQDHSDNNTDKELAGYTLIPFGESLQNKIKGASSDTEKNTEVDTHSNSCRRMNDGTVDGKDNEYTSKLKPSVIGGDTEIALDDLDSESFFNDLLHENINILSTSESTHMLVNNQESDIPNAGDISSDNSGLKKLNDITSLEESTCKNPSNIAEVLNSLTEDTYPANSSKSLMGEESTSKSSNISGAEWSKGCLRDSSGQIIQPVQLLAPTSKHTPGKRPLSPTSRSAEECPAKRKSSDPKPVPAGQLTLTDVMNGRSGSKPKSAFEHFCEDKREQMLESDPDLNEDEDLQESLKAAWQELSDTEKIPYRDKCWNETKRLEREAAAAAKVVKTSKPLKPNKKDDTDLTSANKPSKGKPLKNRLYHCEQLVQCNVKMLENAIHDQNTETLSARNAKPSVIGQAKACDAWFCCRANQLSLVNIFRLAELCLYQKLKKTFKMSTKPCEPPIKLDHKNFQASLWSVLEYLASMSQTGDTYFQLADERLLSNGLDVRCHFDSEGKLGAELAGICDLVPAYNVSDLSEVLAMIEKDPSLPLSDARPTKVLYYLQGEAVRLAQQNATRNSSADVQGLLDELDDVSVAAHCLHKKPLFHDLFDLSDLQPYVEDGDGVDT